MAIGYGAKAIKHVVFECNGTSALQIHLQSHHLESRQTNASQRLHQFVKQVQPLAVEREQPRCDREIVVQVGFTFEHAMVLDHEKTSAARRDVVGTDPECLQQGVPGTIEHERKIRDIHVTVAVKPLAPDALAMQPERRRSVSHDTAARQKS